MNSRIFTEMSIAEIHEEFRLGRMTPMDVARICLDQIEKFEDKYQAWVCLNRRTVLEEAAAAQERVQGNQAIRPLEGIPFAIKDIFNTKDFPTQMGSPLWQGFTPGNDARAVYNLKRAGALIPGKTVTAEFAVHTIGKTLNPHDVSRTPGTSSSGSAVGVALGMVPAALGTQTAGSIVRPASFCGVYGCKPSFGLIPRTGSLKTTDSLDTVGFFTSRLDDLETVFDALRVHGPDYPISYEALKDNARQNKPKDRPWKVALVRTHTWVDAYDYAKTALLNWASRVGSVNDIEILDVDLPAEMSETHHVHATIYNKALSYYFKQEYGKSQLVSPVMNELIRSGNGISPSMYADALNKQIMMCDLMEEFFLNHDILVSLSTAGEAPLRNEVERPDPALMWTMTHLPVVSAPAFISPGGLPFGIQIVSRRYNDYLLFRFLRYLRTLNYIPEGTHPLPKCVLV